MTRQWLRLWGFDCKFLYWCKKGNTTTITEGCLPEGRLVRARPTKMWDGSIKSLTLDDIEPIDPGMCYVGLI